MGLSVKFDFERGSGAGFESGAFREDFFELFSVVYISQTELIFKILQDILLMLKEIYINMYILAKK